MKSHQIAYGTGRTWLATVFALSSILSVAAPALASGPCSPDRAAGVWSFSDMGTIVGLGSRVAVGVFTFDSAGNVSSPLTTSGLNGNIARESFSGTYAVNPDCTVAVTITAYDKTTGAELFMIEAEGAFDDNMNHMRAIFTNIVTPTGVHLASVIGLDARKQ